MHDGCYIGGISGVPCYWEGKVVKLYDWLCCSARSLEGSSFYSDFYNDLLLLFEVTRFVVVDSDLTLEREALERGWSVLSLRGN